ncbi:MAG TPA: DUF6702 family protein [Chryseosolibacter sp.]
MKFLVSLIAVFQLSALSLSPHPMHVSVTEIEFDEKDKALEIMMRVFIDDLELSIKNKLNQPELDLMEPKNGKTIDQMVSDYLKPNFKISLDGKAVQPVYLGHEREDDALIFYIEVGKVKKFKTIQVQNTIITETHDDQNNLVNVTVRETVRSLRLTRNTPVDKITFDTK